MVSSILGKTTVVVLLTAVCLAAAVGTGKSLLRVIGGERAIETVQVADRLWAEMVNGINSKGPATAPLLIVVFEDYQCQACGFWQPVLSKYVQDHWPLIRIVSHHYPIESIHRHARAAAEAAECAGQQGVVVSYHSALFQQQDRIGMLPWPDFTPWLLLDRKAFFWCMTSRAGASTVQRDIELGRLVGIEGTPTFIINTLLYRRPPPRAEFERLIQTYRDR